MNPTVMFVRLSENCNAGCFMCYFAHQHGLYNITDEQCHAIYEDLAKYTNAYTFNYVRCSQAQTLSQQFWEIIVVAYTP